MGENSTYTINVIGNSVMNYINVPRLLPQSVPLKLVVIIQPEAPHGVGMCCLISVVGLLGGALFASVVA